MILSCKSTLQALALGGLVLAGPLALGIPAAVAADAPKFPQASPRAVLKQRVGLVDVEIDYSRPSKNGREIFGGLVPWNEVWRTGANESTKITFSDDVKLGGKDLPAGKYALYTIPAAGEWTIILSKNTSNWGSTGYKQVEDAVRFTAKPETLPAPVETFTLELGDLKIGSATLYLKWDRTCVALPLTLDTVSKVSANVKKAIDDGTKLPDNFYSQAANFYLANDMDLSKAMEWADKAIANNPKPYYLHELKAKIQAKMGDKPGAIASAEKAIEMAKADPDNTDANTIRSLEKLIAGLR